MIGVTAVQTIHIRHKLHAVVDATAADCLNYLSGSLLHSAVHRQRKQWALEFNQHGPREPSECSLGADS